MGHMCGMDNKSNDNMNENRGRRRHRDEGDVWCMLKTINEQMMNSSVSRSHQDSKFLVNISTGAVAEDNIKYDTMTAKTVGANDMKIFAEERLNTSQKGVFDTLHKNKLKTFSKKRKAVQVAKTTSEVYNEHDERDLFVRLIVIKDIEVLCLC